MDLGSGMLHIQEVWSQSSFGCVWIVRLSLSLLLLAVGILDIRERERSLPSQKTGVGQYSSEVRVESANSSWRKDSVGMIDICSRQFLNT